MLTKPQAVDLARDLEKEGRTEWARLRKFVRYARGRQPLPWLPDGVESEYRDIARKSAANWLDLVVRSSVQGLRVDGYGDDTAESTAWTEGWQANGMDARQNAHHTSISVCGYGFMFIFPADDGRVWMRPEAATNAVALFDDPGDEWPRAVLRVIKKDRLWELYDGEARFTITDKQQVTAVAEHGLGHCPVAQMSASFDLLGTPQGEIEPVIPIQDRIVDATFNLQMAAKYGAFPQRWIAGINPGEPMRDADGEPLLDGDGNPVMPTIKAYIDHILMAADPETKFGQFAATDLRQYVEALEAHIRHLAAITQTPPHYLLGSLVNISAEALAAAEAGLMRKNAGKQEVLGEGYEQVLRCAAKILGDDDAADDIASQVHWQDVESRSLSQTADALNKLKDIGVPLPMLYEMIPGWTQVDVERALELQATSDPMAAFARALTGDGD